MPIYDIITPDRVVLPDDIRDMIGEENVHIQTTEDLNPINGFILDFNNQIINIIVNREDYIRFTIEPLNLNISADDFQINIHSTLRGMTFFYNDMFDDTITQAECMAKFNEFRKYITRLHAKQETRPVLKNLTEVFRVGKNRNLPENVENIMASFLTGKSGTITGQANKLKQNVGYHLAPRARKTRRR